MVNYTWNKKYLISFKQNKIININQSLKESHFKIFFRLFFFLKLKITFKSFYVTIQRNFCNFNHFQPFCFQGDDDSVASQEKISFFNQRLIWSFLPSIKTIKTKESNSYQVVSPFEIKLATADLDVWTCMQEKGMGNGLEKSWELRHETILSQRLKCITYFRFR